MRNMAAPGETSSILRRYNGGNAEDSLDDSRELFDSSLITAMRIPDSYIAAGEYTKIADGWKPEWDVAVQIPRTTRKRPPQWNDLDVCSSLADFNLDSHFGQVRQRCACNDYWTQPNAGGTLARRKRVGRYDLDAVDSAWLACVNTNRGPEGEEEIDTALFEIIIEYLELLVQRRSAPARDLGLSESIGEGSSRKRHKLNGAQEFNPQVCDVCRSENDDTDYVRCTSCKVLVHRACYGVCQDNIELDADSWLCKPCASGLTPSCALCLRTRGALKPTADADMWCHVACVLWTPECSLADPVLLEPVIQLELIPDERWNASCSLCDLRGGACLFCSADACRAAFHVRCAFTHSLTMTTHFVDDAEVRLMAYCAAHSKSTVCNGDEDKPMCSNGENERVAPVQLHVTDEDVRLIAQQVNTSVNAVRLVASFWKLKRTTNFNNALLSQVVLAEFADFDSPLFDCGRPTRESTPAAPTKSAPKVKSEVEKANIVAKPIQAAAELSTPTFTKPRSVVEQVRELIGLRKNLDQLRNVVYLIQRRERVRRQHLSATIAVRESQISAVIKSTCNLPEKSDSEIAAHTNSDDVDGSNIHAQIDVLASANASESTTGDTNANTKAQTTNRKLRREALLQRAHVGSSIYDNSELFKTALDRYRTLCASIDNDSQPIESMLTEADYALLTADTDEFLVRYILERRVRARVKVNAVLSKLTGVRKVTLSNADRLRLPNAQRIADRLVKLAKTGRPGLGKLDPFAPVAAVQFSTREVKGSESQATPDATPKRRRTIKKQRLGGNEQHDGETRLERALAYSIPESAFQIDLDARERMRGVFTNSQLVNELLVERARSVLARLASTRRRDLLAKVHRDTGHSHVQRGTGCNGQPKLESDSTRLSSGAIGSTPTKIDWSTVSDHTELVAYTSESMRRANGQFDSACESESMEGGLLKLVNGNEECATFNANPHNSPLGVVDFLDALENELG